MLLRLRLPLVVLLLVLLLVLALVLVLVLQKGLLSADAVTDYSAFDPSRTSADAARPRYWWLDFARAEHPRVYSLSTGGTQAQYTHLCATSGPGRQHLFLGRA